MILVKKRKVHNTETVVDEDIGVGVTSDGLLVITVTNMQRENAFAI